MAVTGIGFQGTTNESGESKRFSLAMINCKVAGAGHLQVSPLQALARGVVVAPGTASVLGVLVDVSEPVWLSLDENPTSSPRADVIVLRVRWGGGDGSSSAEVTVEKSSGPNPKVTVFSPGMWVDFPLAIVTVPPSATRLSASAISNIAPRGGDSELQIVGPSPVGMQVPVGTKVRCDANGDLWQATQWYTFEALKRKASPWSTFDPKVTSRAGAVYLGNGGVSRGRYKIINGYLIGEVELRSGTDKYNWGYGPLSFTLPRTPGSDNAPQDQWFGAHMYTTTGDGLMDWRIQMIVSRGSRTAALFAPRSSTDCRISPLQAASTSQRQAGTGVPYINGGVTDPSVIACTFRYPV